jgi:hypothetical protein
MTFGMHANVLYVQLIAGDFVLKVTEIYSAILIDCLTVCLECGILKWKFGKPDWI